MIRFSQSVIAVVAAVSFFQSGGVQGADKKKLEVEVEAIGTAEIRDRAVIDACRMAVAKVHGTRVLGHMSNTDYATVKLDAAGSRNDDKAALWLEGGVYGVRDNTGLSFDGYLLRFEIKGEEKQPDGRWAVKVLATVLGTAPDRFEGREAVVLPSVELISRQLGGKGASPEMVESVARVFHRWLGDCFSNHPNFVILEREDESTLNSELARSASERSAVKEKSKLKAEKTADISVEVRCEPLVVEAQTTNFKLAPSLNKARLKLIGSVKLLDVSTKGEIGRASFRVENLKPSIAAGSLEVAMKRANDGFERELAIALRPLKFDLFSKLGMVNIVFGENGLWTIGGGFALDSEFLQPGDRVSLWQGEGSSLAAIGESEILIESGRLSFSNPALKFAKGAAFSLRLSRATSSVSVERKVSESSTEAPKPSLRERIKFD